MSMVDERTDTKPGWDRTRIGNVIFAGLLALVLAVVGAGVWWHNHQERQAHDQRVDELSNAMLCNSMWTDLGFSSSEACVLSLNN